MSIGFFEKVYEQDENVKSETVNINAIIIANNFFFIVLF